MEASVDAVCAHEAPGLYLFLLATSLLSISRTPKELVPEMTILPEIFGFPKLHPTSFSATPLHFLCPSQEWIFSGNF